MALVFSNPGFIGAAVGRLTSLQGDGNIQYLWDAIQAKADQGVGIAEVQLIPPNELLFIMTDHSSWGPFSISITELFSALADVSLTTPAIGDRPVFNGTLWTNQQKNPVQTRSGSTWTPSVDDNGAYTRMTNAGGCVVTLPANDDVPFPIGAEMIVRQSAAGPVSFSALSPVSISSLPGYTIETAYDGAVVTLKKIAIDEWDIYGALAANLVQTQSGATWTPSLGDAGTYNRFTNVGGCVVTLPTNAAVAFPIGTEIHCRQAAAGTVFFGATSPADINPVSEYLNETAAEGGTVTLKKIGTDEWDIFGLLMLMSGA